MPFVNFVSPRHCDGDSPYLRPIILCLALIAAPAPLFGQIANAMEGEPEDAWTGSVHLRAGSRPMSYGIEDGLQGLMWTPNFRIGHQSGFEGGIATSIIPGTSPAVHR